MAYIGNSAANQTFTPIIDTFNGNGSTTAFTLTYPVASVAQVEAYISNVPQQPGVAYTVLGNTITFTSAPPSGTANIYVRYTSPITQIMQPGQGTVGTPQLSTSLNTFLNQSYAADILVVGGGGAGGSLYYSGGGGAGGFVGISQALTTGVAYPVVIGAGGAAVSGAYQAGYVGASSIFNGTIAIGGGGGGAYSSSSYGPGQGGGSGGGNSGYFNGYYNDNSADAFIGRGYQGNRGGYGGGYGGGGGGGAGAIGATGGSSSGGVGGAGRQWLNGTTYAGGGGGNGYTGIGGAGGAGGGGAGGSGNGGVETPPVSGTANTGGGGGGYDGSISTGFAGAAGGSGIVIVRYTGAQRGTGGTVTSSGGFTYHTFTSSGTFTA